MVGEGVGVGQDLRLALVQPAVDRLGLGDLPRDRAGLDEGTSSTQRLGELEGRARGCGELASVDAVWLPGDFGFKTCEIADLRGGTPEEAAGAVYMFCIPESNYVSGQVLVCGGGRP